MRNENANAHSDLGYSSYDVVIPCFDRSRTVGRAVASLLAQVPAPARIILVDDGSSDDTAAVLLALERGHASVQAVLLPRNAGLGLARAPWVAFLDSDDEWVSGAAALLAATTAGDVIVGRFRRAWRSGILDAPECAWDGSDIRAALAVTGAIGPSWSLIRRTTAHTVGGFDPSFHNCNDWDFYVRVAAAGARFVRIDATIAHYHVVEDNRLSLDGAAGLANADRVRAHPYLAEQAAELATA